jgi:hypothetical protein
MIGFVQRDEALWMFGSHENLGRIVNMDNVVRGGVKDQQGFFQVADAILHLLLLEII